MIEAAAPKSLCELPTTAKIFLAALVAVFATVFLVTLVPSYVASPYGMKMGLYAGLVSGFAGALGGFLSLKAPATEGKRIRTGLAGGAVFFAFGWGDFTMSLPAVYTHFFGTTGQREAVIDQWSYSRRTCAGIDVAGQEFIRHVCLDRYLEETLPAGTKVTLVGRISALGISVENVRRRD